MRIGPLHLRDHTRYLDGLRAVVLRGKRVMGYGRGCDEFQKSGKEEGDANCPRDSFHLNSSHSSRIIAPGLRAPAPGSRHQPGTRQKGPGTIAAHTRITTLPMKSPEA